MSSADNLSKPFDSLIVFLKVFFEQVDFEKSQQITTKAWKITQHAMQRIKTISLADNLKLWALWQVDIDQFQI